SLEELSRCTYKTRVPMMALGERRVFADSCLHALSSKDAHRALHAEAKPRCFVLRHFLCFRRTGDCGFVSRGSIDDWPGCQRTVGSIQGGSLRQAFASVAEGIERCLVIVGQLGRLPVAGDQYRQ